MTATHWHVKFIFQEFDRIDSVVFVEVASIMIDSVALGLRGFAILSAGAEVFDGLLLGYKSLDGVAWYWDIHQTCHLNGEVDNLDRPPL